MSIIRITPDLVAVIRPASYGIRSARGYLLYWESDSGLQAVDSWQTYPTPAAARAVAAAKSPNAQIIEAPREEHACLKET
jgi:hypothetical protein